MEWWVGRNSVNYKKDHFLFSPPNIPVFQFSIIPKQFIRYKSRPMGLAQGRVLWTRVFTY